MARHRAARVEWCRVDWTLPEGLPAILSRGDVKKSALLAAPVFTRMWGCKLPSLRAIGRGQCIPQDKCKAELIKIHSECRGEYSQGETVQSTSKTCREERGKAELLPAAEGGRRTLRPMGLSDTRASSQPDANPLHAFTSRSLSSDLSLPTRPLLRLVSCLIMSIVY